MVPPAPRLLVFPEAEDAFRKGLEIFVALARKAVAERGRFLAALSGGSTPRPMHRLLATSPWTEAVPWEHTHLFWVDERCVPYHDPESNYGAAVKDLICKVPIPDENIHPMPVAPPWERAATRYGEEILRLAAPHGPADPVLDLVFLGMGADGHTASLFPEDPVLREETRPVLAVQGGSPPLTRLTLTLPLLNRSRQVVFLVLGREKAPAVGKVLLEGARLPPAALRPDTGTVSWLLDREAAQLLPQKGEPDDLS